jgi:hypothetical protein
MPNLVLYPLIFIAIVLGICTILWVRRRNLAQLQHQTRIFLKQQEPIFWTDLQENKFQ